MTTGIVYKIEKFAPHDGPGIRTVVFLKGCPLRCEWCSSPESQKLQPEMVYLSSDCTLCGKCLLICPHKAITREEDILVTDRKKCDNCGKCTEMCLTQARRMIGYEVTVEEIIAEISKDSIFYFNSGGGVTLSGGEITAQPQFATEILKACCEVGIHTTIETCAYSKWEDLNVILEYVGRAYVDIKCISMEKHKLLTGVDNEVILKNIRNIAELEYLELIVRVPVIPGLNDADEDWRQFVEFIKSLKRIYRVELLPYHRYGVHMYQAMARDYPLKDLKSPDDDYMERVKKIVENNGFEVQIGG